MLLSGAFRCKNSVDLPCRGRSGGIATQLIFAALHAATHVATAIFSVMLLELGVETCIRCVAAVNSVFSKCWGKQLQVACLSVLSDCKHMLRCRGLRW